MGMELKIGKINQVLETEGFVRSHSEASPVTQRVCNAETQLQLEVVMGGNQPSSLPSMRTSVPPVWHHPWGNSRAVESGYLVFFVANCSNWSSAHRGCPFGILD